MGACVILMLSGNSDHDQGDFLRHVHAVTSRGECGWVDGLARRNLESGISHKWVLSEISIKGFVRGAGLESDRSGCGL